MPEREVVVCSADEGQQARTAVQSSSSFFSWHHVVFLHVYIYRGAGACTAAAFLKVSESFHQLPALFLLLQCEERTGIFNFQ